MAPGLIQLWRSAGSSAQGSRLQKLDQLGLAPINPGALSGRHHAGRRLADQLARANIEMDATAGDPDLYEVSDLPFTPETIHAVQVTMRARKDDVATREIRAEVKSGVATADGATHAMAAGYRYFRDIHETRRRRQRGPPAAS
jgi:hypothetical protein